jgi:hypothetical protein
VREGCRSTGFHGAALTPWTTSAWKARASGSRGGSRLRYNTVASRCRRSRSLGVLARPQQLALVDLSEILVLALGGVVSACARTATAAGDPLAFAGILLSTS